MAIMLNLMCCDLPLPKPWINIDLSTSEHIKADLILDCTNLSDHFGTGTVDRIYIGHGLEHLYPQQAHDAMEDWKNVLKAGGDLGIVTPDFRFIAQGYLDNDPRFTHFEMIDTYLFSYKQESVHRTIWDVSSLTSLFEEHDFKDIKEIDRISDNRLAYGVEWQMGVGGVK